MAFTDAERAEWHRAKREQEAERPRVSQEPLATCVICHQPFGSGEGDWMSDYPICRACDSD